MASKQTLIDRALKLPTPPGVLPKFWEHYIKNWADPQALQQAANGSPEFLQSGASQAWTGLNSDEQTIWAQAQVDGNPHDPFSPQGQQWTSNKDVEGVRTENQEEFEQFEAEFLPGIRETIAAVEGGDAEALARLEQLLGSIQDPEIADYVGDYISAASGAHASDEAIARQRAEYDKLAALSDPTMTAEERLMQEMSRRQQEADLKSYRGALANDMQARGVYGSGNELTMNLSAASEAAQRRAIDEMEAQANAQTRAMKALEMSGDLATKIRDTEFDEEYKRGEAADIASKFNNELKTRFHEWKAKMQADLNNDKVDRGQTLFEAGSGVRQTKISNADALARLGLDYTTTKTGGNTVDTVPVTEGKKESRNITLLEEGLDY